MFPTFSFRALSVLVVSMISAFGSVAAATEAVITNYSNVPVYVVKAYNLGQHIADGWVMINPNETKTFSAPDGNQLYLRVERDHQEVSFNAYQSFGFWAVCQERFDVTRAPLLSTVIEYRWGQQLEHFANTNAGDPPPVGWDVRRFFAVGYGHHNLIVSP